MPLAANSTRFSRRLRNEGYGVEYALIYDLASRKVTREVHEDRPITWRDFWKQHQSPGEGMIIVTDAMRPILSDILAGLGITR